MTDVRRDVRRPGPWVAALVGLVLLAVLLALALPDAKGSGTLPPPPPPFLPAPSAPFGAALPAGPEFTSAPVASVTSSPPPAPTLPADQPPADQPPAARPAAPPRTRPAAAPPRSPSLPAPSRSPAPSPTREVTVTGRYRVVDSFADGFIGEVLVANTTGAARDWTVRLRFSDDVGALRTSWVEGAPQASLDVAGDTFVWSSGAPVAARSSVALRFHVNRSGTDEQPSACSVNGTTCR